MAERKPSSISSSVSTGKLLKFVRQVDLRKLPAHATAVHQELVRRKAA